MCPQLLVGNHLSTANKYLPLQGFISYGFSDALQRMICYRALHTAPLLLTVICSHAVSWMSLA